jgi:PPOX class probable FMN-dependent enzyme
MLDGGLDGDALRGLYGAPGDLARRKVVDRIDGHCRRFIELSPFLVIGSSDASGNQDVSPRGDPPGFVRVVDDTTLLIPDRPGNRRIDTLGNIAANPRLALIFLVPGVDETLRVAGRGRVTTDGALLAGCAVNGKPPLSGLVVAVEKAFFHCGKALMRARLWDAETRIDRPTLPSLGRMIADQIAGVEPEAADAAVARSYRDTLY